MERRRPRRHTGANNRAEGKHARPMHGAQLNASSIAPARIPEHAIFGKVHDPAAALSAGLVDEIVEPDQLLPRAIERARVLAALPGYTPIKSQMRAATLAELDRANAAESDPILSQWR